MIRFDIDQLNEVAAAAATDLAYWSQVFHLDRPDFAAGDVLLIINAAIASGLVRLPEQDAERKSSYDAGYLRGCNEGRERGRLETGAEFATLYPGLTVQAWQAYQRALARLGGRGRRERTRSA